MKLRAHPRLLISPERWQGLAAPFTNPHLQAAAEIVAEQAEDNLVRRELRYNRDLHNSLLLRAREVQTRVWTLLTRWGMTGEDCYRQAALDYIRDMGTWTYWGWDRLREGNPDPEADFDLSYGENSATLAVAYDLLHATLSEEERAMFQEIAVKWSFRPFLKLTDKQMKRGQPGWWFMLPDCNWNTVCCGGAGMLALAMYDEVPEAKKVLPRADLSVGAYMNMLETTGGGWTEGIGYWGYGHRYAFLYLLSHEGATGQKHPLMEQKGTLQTLEFPLDFCPNGQPCGFGDVNTWQPLAFHFAAAARFRQPVLLSQLDGAMARFGLRTESNPWPNAAELLLYHPGSSGEDDSQPGAKPVAKLYPHMDWGLLADRQPKPNFFLSVRGGTTEVSHSHLDLGSFHCVVGEERLIDNITIDGGDEYLDTTFSGRRWDLFETMPASKNVVLINGVGITKPSRVETTLLKGKGWQALRIDGTVATGASRGGVPAVAFYGRLFLMLDGEVAVILDRVEFPSPGRAEARLHTYSKAEFKKTHVVVKGEREKLQVSFASNVPATLHRAVDALTTPTHDSTVLRWCTDNRTNREVNFVTALAPGGKHARVSVESEGKQVLISVKLRKRAWKLAISKDLLKIRVAEDAD